MTYLSKNKRLEEYNKKRQEYAEMCFDRALQYEKDIRSGKVIACEWIKKAIDRREVFDKKYHFDKESVMSVFRFFYVINITVDNEVSRFNPFGWQCWVTLNVFGYYRDSTLRKRQFRYATIWVARKSAKTTYAAILSLYGLVKGERNSESYFCATTKKQASQALKYLKRIIKDSPILDSKITIRRFHLEHESLENGTCTAEPVPNEPETLDGLSPSFAIIDEKHALPDNALFNIMKTGTLARQNPLMITISTSGVNKDYPFFRETEIGKKVLNGELDDDSTFYAYYQMDDEKEIENPDMWIKSNPSLKDENGFGVIDIEDMKADYSKSCLTRADKINFIVKNLNLYQDGEDSWIPDSIYKKCFFETPLHEMVDKGAKTYLGFDLSVNKDLTSLVAVIEHPETGKLYTVPEFYFPLGEDSSNKIREDGIDLTEWIEKGFIDTHDRIVDYGEVFNRVKWWTEHFDVVSIGYDKWNAIQLVERIKSELMVDMIPCAQNPSFFNFPIKLAERLIYTENVGMSNNPVLRWNVRNVVMWTDGNGNVKYLKNKSKDSIDGCVSFAMALGMYAEHNFDAVSSMFEELNNTIND